MTCTLGVWAVHFTLLALALPLALPHVFKAQAMSQQRTQAPAGQFALVVPDNAGAPSLSRLNLVGGIPSDPQNFVPVHLWSGLKAPTSNEVFFVHGTQILTLCKDGLSTLALDSSHVATDPADRLRSGPNLNSSNQQWTFLTVGTPEQGLVQITNIDTGYCLSYGAVNDPVLLRRCDLRPFLGLSSQIFLTPPAFIPNGLFPFALLVPDSQGLRTTFRLNVWGGLPQDDRQSARPVRLMSSSAAPLPNEVFFVSGDRIVSRVGAKSWALDVDGSSEPAEVISSASDDSENQHWTFLMVGPSPQPGQPPMIQITNIGTGLCLSTNSTNATSHHTGDQVVISPCDNNPTLGISKQIWIAQTLIRPTDTPMPTPTPTLTPTPGPGMVDGVGYDGCDLPKSAAAVSHPALCNQQCSAWNSDSTKPGMCTLWSFYYGIPSGDNNCYLKTNTTEIRPALCPTNNPGCAISGTVSLPSVVPTSTFAGLGLTGLLLVVSASVLVCIAVGAAAAVVVYRSRVKGRRKWEWGWTRRVDFDSDPDPDFELQPGHEDEDDHPGYVLLPGPAPEPESESEPAQHMVAEPVTIQVEGQPRAQPQPYSQPSFPSPHPHPGLGFFQSQVLKATAPAALLVRPTSTASSTSSSTSSSVSTSPDADPSLCQSLLPSRGPAQDCVVVLGVISGTTYDSDEESLSESLSDQDHDSEDSDTDNDTDTATPGPSQ